MKKLFVILMLLMIVGCTDVAEDSIIDTKISGQLRVHFIDVGQGDSILIETPNDKTMLIDGGTRSFGDDVVAYLNQLQIDQLNYVVATHPDADHIGGLIPVLNTVPVENFLDSGKVHTSATYEEMLTTIKAKKIRFSIPEIGDLIKLDDSVAVDVLYANAEANDNNDASIVLKVRFGEVSFLLTGDAGVNLEQQLMQNGDLRSTVLKAGHHGSNTSSSLSFLQQVKPEVTILSYGQNNSYGHPHYEVIQNLQQVGSKIYGTAESGTIVVTTDGKNIDVLADEWTGIGASSSIVKQQATGVIIESKDLENEIVTIKNNSTTSVNLKGWQLLSVEGNQMFEFPNVNLEPGEKLFITSGSDAKDGEDYMKWSGRQIWLNAGDAAQLLNAKGEIVSELP